MNSWDPEMPNSLYPMLQHKQKDRRNIVVWSIVVACGVLLCSGMCFGVFVYTNWKWTAIEERSAEMRNELSDLRSQLLSQGFSIRQAVDEETGNQNRTLQIQRFKRQQRAQHLHSPPFIHLVGKPGPMVTEVDVTYFVWENEPNSPGLHGFDLIGDSSSGFHKITVKQNGVYLVYAQVAVHGRKDINLPHECSHQTVCKRENGDTLVLLSSLVTQYHLGGPYQDNAHKHWMRALDTKVHMGVFMLHAKDVLSVQIPPSCGNMEYSMTGNQSYFGVVKISGNETKKPKTSKPPKRVGNTNKRGNAQKKQDAQ